MKIECGDIFYAFTNWGLSKVKVNKIVKKTFGEEVLTQYKVKILLGKQEQRYGFFFDKNQLFNSPIDALIKAAEEHKVDKIFKFNYNV